FEVWIGDDGMSDFQRSIAMALAKLAQSGTQVYLMHGNRDFLLGRAFCRLARCQLLEDPTVIELNGHRVLLSHGDAFCTQDLAYMRMRRWLRNPLSLMLLCNLPLATRQKLARKLRNESRAQTRLKAAEIVDVTPAEVLRAMRRHRVDTLIHGHTHRPAEHLLELDGRPARRIVLGDWDSRGWALEADRNGLRLADFALT
ncbi:MAG: UDP-2,3-diacylglucosamine diphosphatase, partial [Pseudomonadota bacterium]